MSNIQKTKQIAKNTVVLYMRMIITMLITLFSSRIVLQALGVSDFGLYNVVGGIVALISFFRTSLASSTQRFISYEIGRNDTVQLKKVFSISVSIHFLISVLILIIAESLGLWFLNNYIQIPIGRENAAFWIYQFSVVSLCISAITIPYNADVISHERMSYYALVSIIEAVLKLAFAYALFLFGTDKLILYGGLMTLVNFIDFFLYYGYCKKYFCETKYEFYFDKQLFRQIFSFSGWTIFGQLSVVGANQGTSILINMFHSLTANAAIGISQQVNNAISGLTANFHTAFQPQLTKSFAAHDYDYMNNLICKTSKISYFLLFLASIPIVINIDLILKIWLGDNVPIYTNQFCVLFLAASLCNAIGAPLWTSIYATGKIRNYQIVTSIIFLSDILVVYLLFYYFECSPIIALEVKLIINILIVFVRLIYTKSVVPGFSVFIYVKKCILQVVLVTIITVALDLLLFLFKFDEIERLLLSIPLFAISCLVCFRFGFSNQERQYLISIIKKYKKISIMIEFLRKVLRGGKYKNLSRN